MRKPKTWVLFKWEYVKYGRDELKLQSKQQWQSYANIATDKPDLYRATWLAESTDKAMLEKMLALTKEE